jgi:replicative DNA helicase
VQELATSDVYWDEIVAIEPAGNKQVYDLTIPDTHNFVANDICVHNTAFALGLIRNIIINERQPVFFVSLEQSRIELAERLLCAHSRVDSHKLRSGNLSAEDMQKLIDAGGELRNAKLFIDDSPGQGMLRIAANARRLSLREKIKLVVIDYLQLIEPENRRDPRQEQVAQISRRLKGLARELELPVIALAQVNRASEDRQDHRPRLSDLRESGSIEADADTVMLLHRPERYEPGQHEGVVEVIIGKQRNGPTGEVTLSYIKQYLRFEDFQVAAPFQP